MAKTYNLKVTSATVVGGAVVRAGSIAIDVDDRLARRLLASGKAELATADDMREVGDSAADADEAAEAKAEAKKTGGSARASKGETK